MSTFGTNIYDNSVIDITIGSGAVVSIKDHSNYDTNTENGHEQSDFANYKKIVITNPDGTKYTFCSLGDGDALIDAPADTPAGEPIETLYQSVGDGVYNLTLEAVPTWDSTVIYTSVTQQYVFYDNKLYKALQAVIANKNPATETDYWEEVDDLPAKYKLSQNFAVTCDLQMCFVAQGYKVACDINVYCDKYFCENQAIQNWLKLDIILEHIPDLVDNGEWDRVTHMINLGKQICGCFKTLNCC